MNKTQAANNVILLDNTRKIEKLIHNNDTGKVVFNDICKVMSGILDAHILVISKKGKVLGVGECANVHAAHGLIEDEVGTFVDPELNSRLLDILSTHENVSLNTLGFFSPEDKDLMGIVLPIEVAGERLGTLVASKIADKAGITRSVVVNALRKFESAGVIESRSSGMKGTYIKVLNDAIYGELAWLRKQVQP